MSDTELVNIGIGKESHGKMVRLKEDGVFKEMVDAYRFAVALALAHGGLVTEFRERTNFVNVGSLDRDGSLMAAVTALRQPTAEHPHRTIEKLATWGIDELDRRRGSGTIPFSEILTEVEDLSLPRPD